VQEMETRHPETGRAEGSAGTHHRVPDLDGS